MSGNNDNDSNFDESQNRIYRKLLYYKENNIDIHFRLLSGPFRNGKILDISKEQQLFILDEFVLGEKPFFFEEINESSISKFVKPNELKKDD